MFAVQYYERNEQIRNYLSHVRPITKGLFFKSGCICDDLIQAGFLGLIQASHRLNQTNAGSLYVFTKIHIRGIFLHYLRDSTDLVRLPRQMEEIALKLRDKSEECLVSDDQNIKW